MKLFLNCSQFRMCVTGAVSLKMCQTLAYTKKEANIPVHISSGVHSSSQKNPKSTFGFIKINMRTNLGEFVHFAKEGLILLYILHRGLNTFQPNGHWCFFFVFFLKSHRMIFISNMELH